VREDTRTDVSEKLGRQEEMSDGAWMLKSDNKKRGRQTDELPDKQLEKEPEQTKKAIRRRGEITTTHDGDTRTRGRQD